MELFNKQDASHSIRHFPQPFLSRSGPERVIKGAAACTSPTKRSSLSSIYLVKISAFIHFGWTSEWGAFITLSLFSKPTLSLADISQGFCVKCEGRDSPLPPPPAPTESGQRFNALCPSFLSAVSHIRCQTLHRYSHTMQPVGVKRFTVESIHLEEEQAYFKMSFRWVPWIRYVSYYEPSLHSSIESRNSCVISQWIICFPASRAN